MNYYAERAAATREMYPRTSAAYSWTDANGIRWTLDADGRRFAYVGEYAIREGNRNTGYSVTREIDGDEVRIETGITLAEAIEVARRID